MDLVRELHNYYWLLNDKSWEKHSYQNNTRMVEENTKIQNLSFIRTLITFIKLSHDLQRYL